MRQDSDHRSFDELSVPEKILKVQDLWDRIAQSPDDVTLTETQRTELEHRLLAHEGHPAKYTTWEDLRRRLEERSR